MLSIVCAKARRNDGNGGLAFVALRQWHLFKSWSHIYVCGVMHVRNQEVLNEFGDGSLHFPQLFLTSQYQAFWNEHS